MPVRYFSETFRAKEQAIMHRVPITPCLPTAGARYEQISLQQILMKTITLQRLTREGIANLGPVIETMAAAEGLHTHAVSIRREWAGGKSRDV